MANFENGPFEYIKYIPFCIRLCALCFCREAHKHTNTHTNKRVIAIDFNIHWAHAHQRELPFNTQLSANVSLAM